MNEGFDLGRAATILREAVITTLADMAFLDAQALPGAPPPPAGGTDSRAAIDALKPASCRVEIRAPESFRLKVARILFPDEEAGGGSSQDDALLEILNITTGKFLTDYFGPGKEVKLELPRFLYFNEGEEGQTIVAIGLDVEGDPLEISLSSVRYRY